MRRNLPAILCILALISAAAPATAGDTTVETSTFLSVISPEQYATIRSDLIPPRAEVVGRAGASRGIRDVVVESSVGKVSCGNGTEFACSVPVAEGNETIAVTLIDNLGKTTDAVLHVYVNVDIPPPPWIYVIGTVRDADGRPVPGATVRFESVLPLASRSPSRDDRDRRRRRLPDSERVRLRAEHIGREGGLSAPAPRGLL